jgi:hypothetical protein
MMTMFEDVNRVRRYELKYLISEDTAQEIRYHIRNICKLDKHADPVTNTYIVNNLYFDTPDLKFYYDTRFRKPVRFKPRARYYDHLPGFIFPELKYRNSSIIWKTRSMVSVDEWPNLFYPVLSDREEPVFKARHDTFDEVIHLYQAQPVLQVRYTREPYVAELENYGRVTFDRALSSRLARGSLDLDLDEDFVYYDDAQTIRGSDSLVILEIKVETNVPKWVIDIVEKFNLMQTGFSKYCNGIDCHMGYAARLRRCF